MKVRDVMANQVVTCRSETSLAAAGALMWEHDCGLLPVVSESGKLAGVITDRDICIALSTKCKPSSEITLGELIRETAFVCAPDDDIHVALKMMSREKIRRLPVVDSEGGIVGILSINDIIRRAEKSDNKRPGISYDDVVRTLQAICAHPTVTHHANAA